MIRVYSDHEALSLGAAEFVAQVGREAITERGKFELILSGGSTPRAAYETLAHKTHADRELWEHTHIFWGDERCVPEDHEDSNYRLAKISLLDYVRVPAAQVHRIPAESSDIQEAARGYESELPDRPDLLLLGMGKDTHTASLFPGSPLLHEPKRRVAVAKAPIEPTCRITITPLVIDAVRKTLVLVSGPGKAAPLKRVFAEEGSIDATPARLVRDAIWFVDSEAAQEMIEAGSAPLGARIEWAT